VGSGVGWSKAPGDLDANAGVATPRAPRRFAPLLRGRWRWVSASLIVAVVASWATRAFWWPGRYVVTFDGYTYSGPNLELTAAGARRWTLALWNDSIFGGVSHLGNPQAGTLYPPRLLTLLFETNRAMGVLVALHVIVLGLGFVALARNLGCCARAATVGGAALVLSGMTLTKTTQFEQILVIAWMPWLLVAIRRVLRDDRPWRNAGWLAIVTAAVLTAGHPQMVFEAVVLAAAAVIGFVDRAHIRRLGQLAGGVALGAVIAAPQLIAAALATRDSAITAGRNPAQLLDPAYSTLPSAGVRALLGSVTVRDPVAFVGGFEAISFVGVALVSLAAIGFVDALGRRDRRQWVIAFTSAAVVSGIWAGGPRTLVFRAARRIVPGFDLARVSSRWLIVVVIVVVLLATSGIDAVLRGEISRRTIATASGALGIGALVVVLVHVGDRTTTIQWLTIAALSVGGCLLATAGRPGARGAAAAAVALLVVMELGLMSLHSLPQLETVDRPFTSDSYRTATTNWLRGRPGYTISFTDDLRPPDYAVPGLRPNANVLADVRSIDGYDGGVWITKRWAAALRRLNPTPDVELPLRNAALLPLDTDALGRLGVHYVLIDRSRPVEAMVPGWIGPTVSDDRFVVYENPAWRGEAVAWPSVDAAPSDQVPDLLRTRSSELRDTLLVASPADALACRSACQPVGLTMTRSSPEHASTVVDLTQPSVVTFDQQFDAGWTVTVDGRPADPIEADALVVGVGVGAGRHTIDFRYRPRWLTPALILAGLGALAAVGLAAGAGDVTWWSRGRRRTPTGDPPPR
jgi:hypothetical protein